MRTLLLVFAGALALRGQCGPGQQLAPQPVKNKTCINTPQVVVSAPVAVSALPAPSSQNANQILVVSNTTNCTSTSGTTPMLCMSTGSAWVPVGGGGGTTPSPLTGGLVAEYRLDEQVGRVAINYVYPHVVTNKLLGNSLTMLSQCNATCINTANYALNRDGLKIASRVQVSGSNIAYTTTSPTVFASGVTYTLSLDAISNTGSAQTIRLGVDYQGTIGSNLTVGTTWSRVSWTFTADSGSQYIILYPDAGGDAVDISYDRLQLEYGTAPTAWDSHLWNIQLGKIKWLSDSTVPTWSAPWLVFSGGQRAYGLGDWSPITLSNMSMYAVVQQTAESSQAQPVLADDTLQFGLWPSFVNGPSFRAVFGSLQLAPNGIRVADGNPHVLAATYDGTTMVGYLDGVPVASTTGAINPITLTGLGLGNVQNTYMYNGKVGYASLYDVAHPAATVAANSAILKACMASLGVTIPAWRNWVMFEGDSITAGAAGTPFGYTAQTAITPYPQGIITAIPASNIANLVSREAADNALLQQSPTRNVLIVLIGANDMGDAGGASAFVANVKSYCLAMRAAGWSKIVVLTVLPRTFSGFNDWRNSVNALIVADSSFYDALVRLDLDPVIGCDACAANTTYYNADGLHPNTTGENVIAADLVPVLQGVLQ